jgi:steroid 5-alpha reductase family enzyme
MRRFTAFTLCCCALFLAALIVVSGDSPLAFAGKASPPAVVALLAASLAVASFAFGIATRDYSWVDRLWSTAPVVFAWFYAFRGGLEPTGLLAAALVTVWGARLTYNFARRGGYSGTEDYRWSILRDRIQNPLAWQLFNAFFICAFQVGVLVLFTSPIYRISSVDGAGAPMLVLLASVLALGCVALETRADAEQWEFQARKANARKAAGTKAASTAAVPVGTGDPELRRGFISSGLFRYSRHPNYFGELGFWWSVYLVGCAADGSMIHWTIVGPIALTLVFIGSTAFTESISAAKYPDYEEYRHTTSPIVPWLPGKSWPGRST